MKQIWFVVTVCFFLSACGGDASVGGVKVTRGDPNRHLPVKKEKGAVIKDKFSKLGMTVQCPTSCIDDYDSSLQLLNAHYLDFAREKTRIEQINLTNADVGFAAKTKTVTLPATLSETHLSDLFTAQSSVERAESTINFIHFNFPIDKFQLNVVANALNVATRNSPRLKALAPKIQWIDFSNVAPGPVDCQNQTWTVDHSTFESHFDQAYADLLKCLGVK